MEQRHSRLGVASFVVSIAAAVLWLSLFVMAPEIARTGGGLLAMVLFADFVAVGLGVAGLCVMDRKRIFAILGIAFAAVTFLAAIFTLMITMAMEAGAPIAMAMM